MRLRYQLDRLERSAALDPPARLISGVWDRVLPNGRVRDLLHGTWLGHPLHPALTDVPIGCWTCAGLLDAVGGNESAAQTLVGAGVLGAVPTIVSGAADYVAIGAFDKPKRVGVAHVAANATATVLYTWSWLARRRGDHRRGVWLGAAGAACATAGGMLGGHLAYRMGIGTDHTAGEQGPEDWVDVCVLRDLPMRQAVRRRVGDVDVLLYRLGSTVRAISATCSHLGGPLDEGEIDDECVTCPWHGSVFRLADGSVVHGPATAPQPAYEVRVVGRTVQVRLEREPRRERLTEHHEEAPLPA